MDYIIILSCICSHRTSARGDEDFVMLEKSYLKKDLFVFPSSCKIENDSFKNPRQALSCIGRSGRLRLNKADGVAQRE